MISLLETDRLQFRELTHEDALFIVELVNTAGWLKYIGDRNVKTNEQAINYLDQGPIKSYRENGFGLWLVETKEQKKPIGICGFLRRDYLDHPDIGFAFLPDYHGKGLAQESAQACLAYGRKKLKMNVIYAITLPSNQNSIKLLEKIGLTYVSPFNIPVNNEELLLDRLEYK
jgi:RimJ/RimL family protein N-acetyltransferase